MKNSNNNNNKGNANLPPKGKSTIATPQTEAPTATKKRKLLLTIIF